MYYSTSPRLKHAVKGKCAVCTESGPEMQAILVLYLANAGASLARMFHRCTKVKIVNKKQNVNQLILYTERGVLSVARFAYVFSM